MERQHALPMSWDKLVAARVSKSQIRELMGLSNYPGIDTALPQHWLDRFHKLYCLDYNQVLVTTFWAYADKMHGHPISACTEVDAWLKQDGWMGYHEVMAKIKQQMSKIESEKANRGERE